MYFIIYEIVSESTNLKQYIQSHVGNITHGVLKGPDHRVKDQFELGRRYIQERLEAVRIHRLQQLIEAKPMLGEVLEVLVDHVQRALEDGVENFWYLIGDMLTQFIHNGGHRTQDLGLSCRWYFTALKLLILVISLLKKISSFLVLFFNYLFMKNKARFKGFMFRNSL